MHASTTNMLRRQLFQKFWAPFGRKTVAGVESVQESLNQTLDELTSGTNFSCTWNGHVGGADVIHSFFTVLLSGFDICDVSLHQASHNNRTMGGTIRVLHSRPFLNWLPTHREFVIPFSMSLESVRENSVSHITFRSNLKQELLRNGCPEEITSCIDNGESMKCVAELLQQQRDLLAANAPQWVVTPREQFAPA